jgi:ATP-dependent Lon protease
MPKPTDDARQLLDLIEEDRAECAQSNPKKDSKDSTAESTGENDGAPLPVVLLWQRGWPPAAEALWRRIKNQKIEGLEYEDLSDEFFSGQKDRCKAAALALAERLFAVGAGEQALAAQMLAADPQQPGSFQTFLPQLAHAIEHVWDWLTAPITRPWLRARLEVWWRAARGDFASEPHSIFWLAHLELPESDKPVGEPTPSKKPAQAPGLAVMPKAKATKLPSWTATEFRDLIDARLPLVCARDVARVRAALLAEYPHAITAVDLVLRDLREGEPVRLKPVLLVGPPGNGKSRFVRRLADLLGVGVYRFDGSASSDSVGFGGTPKGWANTTPSVPSRAVQQMRIANPIVMVDEIEKAGVDVRSGRLWEIILGFLERETAARYRDVSLDAELDLSWVSHIATANSIEHLPAPVKDRYRIVRVPTPRLADLPTLAAGVLREIAAESGEQDFIWPLADDELDVIGRAWEKAGFSIRKLQKIVSATVEARNATAMRH